MTRRRKEHGRQRFTVRPGESYVEAKRADAARAAKAKGWLVVKFKEVSIHEKFYFVYFPDYPPLTKISARQYQWTDAAGKVHRATVGSINAEVGKFDHAGQRITDPTTPRQSRRK